MSGASAFRPCGRELAEFFKSTGWALHVQVTEAVFSFRSNWWRASSREETAQTGEKA
jgi:hypothetical protein